MSNYEASGSTILKWLDLVEPEFASTVLVDCAECGDEIAKGRLELIPNTKFCVSCAENKDPQSRQNRKINETWGTREDWKRDRSSWKRTH